jgi:carbon starvation protein
LLIVSVWLKQQGKPFVYTLIPMALVGSVTLWAMAGNLATYFGDFEQLWLLAISGSLILVFDIWIMIEGLRLIVGERRAPAPA